MFTFPRPSWCGAQLWSGYHGHKKRRIPNILGINCAKRKTTISFCIKLSRVYLGFVLSYGHAISIIVGLRTTRVKMILGNMCIAIVSFTGCGVKNFEINLIFLIKLFFLRLKSQNKNLNILRTKRALRWNKKYFLSFLKGFQLPKIVSDLRVRL